MKKNEITINWHIIEKCNYKCNYCFAKYDNYTKKEVHESKIKTEILLNKVYHFFTNKYSNQRIRLNIAGGEPMLSKNISFIIKKAYDIGFKVSIITNASYLTSNFIKINSKYISLFGISIDSINTNTNIKIGRISKNKGLNPFQLIKNIELIKNLNKNVKIKINTVVNTYNYIENLSEFIDLIKPYKWKVLQALSFGKETFCTDKQFLYFLNNHRNINTKISKESNDDMTDSYIMIDPHGRFYQNTIGNYIYSKSIIDIEVAEAFSEIEFDIDKYNSRYVLEKK